MDALRASTAAEASSSKAELEKLRAALLEQQASLSARAEALTAGWWAHSGSAAVAVLHSHGMVFKCLESQLLSLHMHT